MSLESILLNYSADKLVQLCGRIEICVDKLEPEHIWSRTSENANAIGNLMLHLSGNLRQWILHGVGGAPDIRVRDAEFDTRANMPIDELKHRLRSTVEESAAVLRAFPHEKLIERRIIQTRDVTILEAILQVTGHFSEHTGQIIFLTKFLTGEDLAFFAPRRAAQ